jgi:1-acyl-sn-glycerol-3-phosphate acyltransferase
VPSALWYGAQQAWLKVASRLLWRLRVEGRERLPREGAFLLVSTHESFLDPLVVGAWCRRHVWHMARRTLFFTGDRRSRFRTWLGTLSGVIEVDREGGGREALRLAMEKLRAGEGVLVFPEGTRSDGTRVLPFRAGAGLLATRTGAAAVPVSLEGTHRVWGRGRKFPRLFGGPARLVFGEPVTYGETTDPGDAAADLRRRVLALRGIRESNGRPEADGAESDPGDRRPGTEAGASPAVGEARRSG